MKRGDVVYNEWHGIRRYGIVETVYTKEGQDLAVPWSYAKVKWFNDAPYENAVRNTNKLRNDGSDIYLGEYRVDQITKVNIRRELATLFNINQLLISGEYE